MNNFILKIVKYWKVMLVGVVMLIILLFIVNAGAGSTFERYGQITDSHSGSEKQLQFLQGYLRQTGNFSILVDLGIAKDEEEAEQIAEGIAGDMPSGNIPTSTTATSGKIVFLDAGHNCSKQSAAKEDPWGWTTSGAAGEAQFTMDVLNACAAALTNAGYTVRTTEDYELWIDSLRAAGTASYPFPEQAIRSSSCRAQVGNAGRQIIYRVSDADILIQFHYDGYDNTSVNGGHIICPTGDSKSMELASAISAMWQSNDIVSDPLHIDFRTPPVNGGSTGIDQRNNLTLFPKDPFKPMVLIEFGCNSNSADYSKLHNAGFPEYASRLVLASVNKYFEGK